MPKNYFQMLVITSLRTMILVFVTALMFSCGEEEQESVCTLGEWSTMTPQCSNQGCDMAAVTIPEVSIVGGNGEQAAQTLCRRACAPRAPEKPAAFEGIRRGLQSHATSNCTLRRQLLVSPQRLRTCNLKRRASEEERNLIRNISQSA